MEIIVNDAEAKEIQEFLRLRNERAAIVGYWRSGATWMEIAGIMNITLEEAEKTVNDYLKQIKQNP